MRDDPSAAGARGATAAGMRTLARWLLGAEWRSHPGRVGVAIATIALGVALGYAVQLINGAAFAEFSAAARSLSGQADLEVRGTQATFDERVYPQLATLAGVVLASPVLELDATVPARDAPLKLLGLDVFRAAGLTPELIGVPAAGRPFDTLADDAVFLSAAAQQWLDAAPGQAIRLRSGTADRSFRVAGGLVRTRPGQRLGVMDIAAAQWRFGLVGRLSRVDLKLARGVDREAFRRTLQTRLGPAWVVSEPRDIDSRTDRLSRAYRINMNVLALVALFTGAFLVFSTQAASVVRRRAQFALLRVLGWTRGQLLRQVLREGALLGVVGAALGLAVGYALATAALRLFGSDLGGGYFPGVRPQIHFSALPGAIFFALGVGVAVAGSLVPAAEAARARAAAALKAGSEENALAPLAAPWPALGCFVAAAVLTQLPPLFEVPILGYLAVALLLIGGIALMPRVTALVFGALLRRRAHTRDATVATLALARLANAPGQAAIAMGGVLSSFALIVAMAVMVASFRESVDGWLTHLLSADLYVRMAPNGDTAGAGPGDQQRIATTPGVRHVDFMRTASLTLDPARPAVALLARDIDARDPGASLQLTSSALPPGAWHPGDIPIWVSEAMVDLYGYHVGQTLNLPLAPPPDTRSGGADHLDKPRFVVAGIWRDYVRQSGAIALRRADYRRLTHDDTVTDAAITTAPGADVGPVIAALRRLPFGTALSFAQPGEIRAKTLTIFDRSFAVTYLLEAVAIIIGLFGVAATFSAQTLARAREFGMLRHIGLTRRQVLGILAAEGGMLTALGIGLGAVLGFAISLILIDVVNPQSFHWTMSLHMPWTVLGIVAATMLAASCVTAVVAGRKALSVDAIRAVKEDW
ncbi:ABC transporter permease [Robbsia sp. Bb-Pol-6]|uniref:ABC transporter permease n=1 Tax=Robbsia betulipollinis TaxID=2981849 RepID=A0ABT3ZKT6_9BURK|nr:ABC transporter permease [Robbsia betulipollinis]MCY0386555.1 ABC transporter permease [Robbsia betulipollinis]